MKCQKCNYTWIPRKSNPVSCPRCKTRLDYNKKDIDKPIENINGELKEIKESVIKFT